MKKTNQSQWIAQRISNVNELLSITPSAIYLKFVWQNLVLYQQDKLNNFILSNKSYRGVFFIQPKDRELYRPKEEKMERKLEYYRKTKRKVLILFGKKNSWRLMVPPSKEVFDAMKRKKMNKEKKNQEEYDSDGEEIEPTPKGRDDCIQENTLPEEEPKLTALERVRVRKNSIIVIQ